jgi:uncharacterized protein YndB with AHSA1/START domain
MTNTEIIAEEGKQELFIVREFDASRERVFEAFSNPEILCQFFAPFDLTMHFNHHDYKSGGSYSWCNKKGEKTVCTFSGVIHELTPPLRIIQTAEYMEMPVRGNVVLEIITFEELPNNKTKVTIHDICPSLSVRGSIVKSGMEKGIVDIFNKLDNLFSRK